MHSECTVQAVPSIKHVELVGSYWCSTPSFESPMEDILDNIRDFFRENFNEYLPSMEISFKVYERPMNTLLSPVIYVTANVTYGDGHSTGPIVFSDVEHSRRISLYKFIPHSGEADSYYIIKESVPPLTHNVFDYPFEFINMTQNDEVKMIW